MRAQFQLLSALLVLTAPSAVLAGDAATWSPPALVPARSATPPAPVSPPEPSPAPEPIAAAPTQPVAVADTAEEPAPRARPARKRCKKGKAACSRRRPKVDPRLLAARAERELLLAAAGPMAEAGRSGDAARMLASGAELHADPILYLAAAEAELADGKLDGERLARALRLTEAAQRLISEPTELRITPAEGPQLAAEAQELAAYAHKRQNQVRQLRRGKAEVATGATFLVLGAAGVGMLTAGSVLSTRVGAARDAYTGADATYLAALDAGKSRAGTLLAAGLVSGLVGAAIGIPLTVFGSRDLKRARSGGPERPSFRLAPGFAALSISGSF